MGGGNTHNHTHTSDGQRSLPPAIKLLIVSAKTYKGCMHTPRLFRAHACCIRKPGQPPIAYTTTAPHHLCLSICVYISPLSPPPGPTYVPSSAMPPTTGPTVALRLLRPSSPLEPMPRALRRARRLPVLPSASSCGSVRGRGERDSTQ